MANVLSWNMMIYVDILYFSYSVTADKWRESWFFSHFIRLSFHNKDVISSSASYSVHEGGEIMEHDDLEEGLAHCLCPLVSRGQTL